jgi:Glyoxalase-like domain
MSDTPTPAIGLVLDCADPERLARFWAPALDYVDVGTAGAYAVLLPNGRPGPKLLLQKIAEPTYSEVRAARDVKNGVHLDVRAAPGLQGEERHAFHLHLYRISGFLPGLSAVQQTW